MAATQRPQAVMTGIGLVTPLGRNVSEFYRALCVPRSSLARPSEGRPAAALVDAPGDADLTGRGATMDAHHLIAPAPDVWRLADCMRIALASADRAPGDVGYVNVSPCGLIPPTADLDNPDPRGELNHVAAAL